MLELMRFNGFFVFRELVNVDGNHILFLIRTGRVPHVTQRDRVIAPFTKRDPWPWNISWPHAPKRDIGERLVQTLRLKTSTQRDRAEDCCLLSGKRKCQRCIYKYVTSKDHAPFAFCPVFLKKFCAPTLIGWTDRLIWRWRNSERKRQWNRQENKGKNTFCSGLPFGLLFSFGWFTQRFAYSRRLVPLGWRHIISRKRSLFFRPPSPSPPYVFP